MMSNQQKKLKVLIVDDIPENIHILMSLLKDDYAISAATDGVKALNILQGSNIPDIILLDVMMPGIDGYEVCRRIKAQEKTKNIPIIFVTALSEEADEAEGLKLGAVDYITKPFIPSLIKARMKNHVELKLHRDHLEDIIIERTKELALTQDITIHSLASLAETRDNETGGHIIRTQEYVKLLAVYLKDKPGYKEYLTPQNIELLYKSSPLHDIGKVGVPDCILLKPGKLTPEEFEKMKEHTTLGMKAILNTEKSLKCSSSFLSIAREIAYTHHEKWAGGGYPQGISGEEIPICGRIMAVADVYDALISKRCYKEPFSHSKARSIMLESKGTHFDPVITDAFEDLNEEFRNIALEFADFEEEKEALCTV